MLDISRVIVVCLLSVILPSPANGDPTGGPKTIWPEKMERVLNTENAFLVADDLKLLGESLKSIRADEELLSDAKAILFNLKTDGSVKTDGSSLTSIDWHPTHDAALLKSTFGINRAVLTTNNIFLKGNFAEHKSVQSHELGIIGESAARYMVLGGNPMRNYKHSATSINEQMHQFLENSMNWLTKRDDLKTTPFKAVIAQMHGGGNFPDESAVREWLDERYPNQALYNAAGTCDDTNLADCLKADADLLIISGNMNSVSHTSTITTTVKAAMNQGTPIIYLHLDGHMNELANALFSFFGVEYFGDNNWPSLEIKKYDASQQSPQIPYKIEKIQAILNQSKAAVYDYQNINSAQPNIVGDREP